MVEFMNWFLLFVKDAILMLFGLVSVDGYSLGNMLVAVAIIGVVISSTIGMVALASRTYARHSSDAPASGLASEPDKGSPNDSGVRKGY